MYNFLQQGYQQYQLFEVTTYHEENDTLFEGNCTNSREAIIVSCDLYFIESNTPIEIVPNISYNLTEWWNSTTSVNTDVTYIINGQEYNPQEVESIQFSATEYSNGEDIKIVIQENNNPLGCKLETKIKYNNCTISPILEPYYVNSENQYTFPYNFAGVLENITTFSFRLEWCETGFFGIGVCTAVNTYVSNWIDVEPNNLIESGELEDILAQYPAADPVNFNESPTPPIYQTFTSIKDYMDANIYTNGLFRMRFRAQNGTGCIEEHPSTTVLSVAPPQPTYNTLHIYYSSTLKKACCQHSFQTVYTSAPNIYSLLHSNTSIIPSPPPILSSRDPFTYAPTGWYTDGEVARYWNGEWGYWGSILDPDSNQATSYIFCDNNIHIRLDQC